MGKPFRITLHHSAHDTGDGSQSYSETASLIQSIQRNHLLERGWGDIGYHFIVDGTGRIWQGRSLGYQGAHAGDGEANRGNIGIVATGNFSYARPSAAQVAALKWLVSYLRRRYGIPEWQVYGHSHFKPTDCPGRYLTAILPSIR